MGSYCLIGSHPLRLRPGILPPHASEYSALWNVRRLRLILNQGLAILPGQLSVATVEKVKHSPLLGTSTEQKARQYDILNGGCLINTSIWVLKTVLRTSCPCTWDSHSRSCWNIRSPVVTSSWTWVLTCKNRLRHSGSNKRTKFHLLKKITTFLHMYGNRCFWKVDLWSLKFTFWYLSVLPVRLATYAWKCPM